MGSSFKARKQQGFKKKQNKISTGKGDTDRGFMKKEKCKSLKGNKSGVCSQEYKKIMKILIGKSTNLLQKLWEKK